MPVPHRKIRGRLHYTSDAPGREGQERGREHFTITVAADGRRTLRALTEIDDPPNVLRDVTLSLGADWRPLDAFVRLSVGDRFGGSSWFRFSDTMAECEGYTAGDGRISQRWPLERPLAGFGTHPIQADAWLTSMVDLGKGPSRGEYDDLLMCSLDHRGATGPMLFSIGLNLVFVGPEKVTVGAGTFDALHFQFVANPELPQEHPPYDVWCTADGEFIFLKGQVAGYMQTYYELVELSRGPHWGN